MHIHYSHCKVLGQKDYPRTQFSKKDLRFPSLKCDSPVLRVRMSSRGSPYGNEESLPLLSVVLPEKEENKIKLINLTPGITLWVVTNTSVTRLS